mgnify:CR=1 FL=1
MRALIDLDGWADVVGYEGLYQVHPYGCVRSVDKEELMVGRHPNPYLRKRLGREITPHLGNAGYFQVGLYKEGVCKRLLVHRLVATAFCPNPQSKGEVNHIDECKTNNRSGNLEWCTRTENALHSSHKNRGESRASSILTEKDVLKILTMLEDGITIRGISICYGVSYHTIHKIKSGKNWQWLTGLGKGGDTLSV